MDRFVNKVFHGDARRLLAALPSSSIDSVITDAMYGTAKQVRYEWGEDPARGDPSRHWQYHEPIYRECLRVLKPGGALAWGQGGKFVNHFPRWFGGHRLWTLTRFAETAPIAVGNVWVVQTRERRPIEFPSRDSLVMCDRSAYLPLRRHHPCPKPREEMIFIVESLTKPGQIVLDCFCGLGSTLIAAEILGRRWIGCDLSRTYCQIAMSRLARVQHGGGEPTPRSLLHSRDNDQAAVISGHKGLATEKPDFMPPGPKLVRA